MQREGCVAQSTRLGLKPGALMQASTQGLVRELAERREAEGARVLCPVPLVVPPLKVGPSAGSGQAWVDDSNERGTVPMGGDRRDDGCSKNLPQRANLPDNLRVSGLN